MKNHKIIDKIIEIFEFGIFELIFWIMWVCLCAPVAFIMAFLHYIIVKIEKSKNKIIF